MLNAVKYTVWNYVCIKNNNNRTHKKRQIFTCCVIYYQYERLGVMSQHSTPAVFFMPTNWGFNFPSFTLTLCYLQRNPARMFSLKHVTLLEAAHGSCGVCHGGVTYLYNVSWLSPMQISSGGIGNGLYQQGRGRQGEPRRASRLENNPDSPN